MSVCINQITFENIFYDILEKMYKDFSYDFDHETDSEYTPYGDTFVEVSCEPTEESEQRCLEEFKDNLDLDTLYESITESSDFREKLNTLIDKFNA